MTSFYSNEELEKIGFKSIGRNVSISRKASIYLEQNIAIGNNVRIDDFCILSGKITLGNNIHIAAFSALFGGEEGILMQDFSGLSSRVVVYAVTDDYSGDVLTNPTISIKYRKVIGGPVQIGRHVIIGTACVVLPGVTLGDGSSFGAMSLINKSAEPWSVNIGIPCKKMKERSRNLLKLEEMMKKEQDLNG